MEWIVEYLTLNPLPSEGSEHTHPIADVDGLQAALDAKQVAGDYAAGTHNHDLAYAAIVHDHDAAYEPKNTNIQAHVSSTSNPHSVTKTQVGLANVDNTSDAGKPVSTATQTALNAKEPANANIQAHVVSAHAPANAQKNSDILKSEIEAVLTGQIASHTHAGSGGDPSYSPGSFTIATETQRNAPHHVKLTGSQRTTIEGTGRLRCG